MTAVVGRGRSALLWALLAVLFGAAGATGGAGRPVPTSRAVTPPPHRAAPAHSTPAPATTTATGAPAPDGIPGRWRPVFADEFTGDALSPVWCPGWFGRGTSGPINLSETGHYLSRNVTVTGGTLQLYEDGHHGALVSANPDDGCHHAHPGFEFAYGAIEFRAWLPAGPDGRIADWPALWLNGQQWPQDGEIDVMEGLSGTASAHYHYGTGKHDWHPGNGTDVPGRWAGGWHTFAADWQPGTITFYYDGHPVWHTAQSVVGSPMYPVIDYTADSADTTTPGTLKIDYVRIWQSAP